MARTKQTARKCMASKAPIFRGSRGGRGGKGVGGYMKSSPAPGVMVPEPQQDIADTQQFVVKFDDQAECEKKAVKGKFLRCKQCTAILTAQSKILSNKQYRDLQTKTSKARLQATTSDQIKQKYMDTKQSVWICEFCCTHNEIDPKFVVDKEQNPCFQVDEIKKRGASKNKKAEQEDGDQILIFCIDISSSMEDTVHTDKKGSKDKLQCVREAIIDQMRNLREKGTKKVGIVTFGSEVHILGDGSKPSTKLQCNIYDFDEIVKASGDLNKCFSKNISQSYDKLKGTVEKMFSSGSTALGPALIASITIASKGGLGSKVIICTDGEANTGIGNAADVPFYDRVANYAREKHVGVSVLTIKGASCNVKNLGRVSSASRGSILKVDPTKLGTEFSKIISNEVLGVDSEVVILLNKRFKFRGVQSSLLSDHDRVLKDQLGNFSADTELTYSFDVIPAQQAMDLKHVNPDLYNQKNLPMQVQLSYTGLNGNRYLQVFTDWREMTTDEAALFEDANFGVFGASILQKASKHIKDQEFDQAEKLFTKYKKLCTQKFSKFKENEKKIAQFNARIERLEGVIKSKKLKKTGVRPGRRFESEDEEEDQSACSDSRSRSRSRGRGGRGGARGGARGGSRGASKLKSRAAKVTTKAKKAIKEKQVALSSDEENAVLYKELEAHEQSEDE